MEKPVIYVMAGVAEVVRGEAIILDDDVAQESLDATSYDEFDELVANKEYEKALELFNSKVKGD